MSERLNFLSPNGTTSEVEVSRDCSWEELLAQISAATGMFSVSYIELYNGSLLVGERIIDIEEFWSTCNYYSNGMVFKAFGQPSSQNVERTSKNADHSSLDVVEESSYTPSVELSTDTDMKYLSDTQKYISSILDSQNSVAHTPVFAAQEQTFTSVGGLGNSDTVSSPSHVEEGDFSSSLATLMSGLNNLKVEPKISQFDFDEPICSSENKNSMANLKTSAELEMERIQEEEEQRRLAEEEEARRLKYEEDARQMRELLQRERAEAAEREEEERRKYDARIQMEQKLKEEKEKSRLDNEKKKTKENEECDIVDTRRQHAEELSKQRLQLQEERRRAFTPQRNKETEGRLKGKFDSKTRLELAVERQESELTMSSFGSFDDDDDEWLRSTELSAKKRAIQAEKKKRADTMSAQRKTDVKSSVAPGDNKIPSMGSGRLRAIKAPSKKSVDIYFRTIFTDSSDDKFVCINLSEECDWVDLTTAVSISLDLLTHDKIEKFVLLDEDGEETSSPITDDKKFWNIYQSRYSFEDNMVFLVYHSLRPQPKRVDSPERKSNVLGGSKPKPSKSVNVMTASRVVQARQNSDNTDDCIDVSIPNSVRSWSEVAHIFAGAFQQNESTTIRRLALFDEDGDELTEVKSVDELQRILERRYTPNFHVLVVEFDTQSTALNNKLRFQRTTEPSSASRNYSRKDTVSINCQLEDGGGERVVAHIPTGGKWDVIAKNLVNALNCQPNSTVTNIRLVDDDGDEICSTVMNDGQFWKAVNNNRYDGDVNTFIVSINEGKPLMSIFFRLDSMSDKISVSIPQHGTWDEISSNISRAMYPGRKCSVSRIDLIDDDGDHVLTAIASDNKFWKAVQNRYKSAVMFFVPTFDFEENLRKTNQLNFRLSTESPMTKHAVDIPEGGSWDDVVASILAYFNFDVPCNVIRLDLVDEDGDDVFSSIVNERKFWKAVNNRYSESDMSFVVTVEEAEQSGVGHHGVPTLPINVRLSTESPMTKHAVGIPEGGSWDDVVASILAYFNFDVPCNVIRLDLVDEDGDDVFSSIVNERKFWKAVNNRYSESDMSFVVTVEEAEQSGVGHHGVPTLPINVRLSTESPMTKHAVDIPEGGSWDDVVASILAYFNFDVPCNVIRLDLVDEDGDDVFSSIVNERKFWKAVNNRYSESDMSFVVTVEEAEQSGVGHHGVPTLPINVRLSTESPMTKHAVDIPEGGSWDDVVASILAYFNFDVPCNVIQLDLVDEDGDDVFSSIVNERKFWKAVNNRYSESDMSFVVTVEEAEQSGVGHHGVPTLPINVRLSTESPMTKHAVDIPEGGSWDDVVASILAYFNFDVPCNVIRLDLVDEDGDDVFSSIVNERKFWKAVNNRYSESDMSFVATLGSTPSDMTSDMTTLQDMDSINSRSIGSRHSDNVAPPSRGLKPYNMKGNGANESFDTDILENDGMKNNLSEMNVSICFKLRDESCQNAYPINIPAMGEWEDICGAVKKSFGFAHATAIDSFDLIDDKGRNVKPCVKNSSEFWKACIDVYKEGISMFNVNLAKTFPVKEVLRSDSMDHSDHTSLSNLSLSGHNNNSNINNTIINNTNNTNAINNSSSSTPVVQHKCTATVPDFLRSCCSGDLEFISNCLQKGFNVNGKDDVGLTGLHVAAIQGQAKVIDLLLEKGAQISCRDVDGMTPLHFACENSHVQIAISLTRGGADTSLRNKVGLTALHYICMNGLMPLTVLIRDYMINVATSAGLTLLHCAADMGHIEIVRYLVEHDAQIMPRDDDGMTPLHLACIGGHIDCVQYLVSHGAYWNSRDDEGMSPFLLACREGNVELATVLADLGASIHVRNDIGNTALHLACEFGSLNMAKFLLEKNMDINCRNQGSETPLIIAMRYGHENLVAWLQDRGATSKSESRDEAEMRYNIDFKAETAARAFESEEEMSLEQERSYRISQNHQSHS